MKLQLSSALTDFTSHAISAPAQTQMKLSVNKNVRRVISNELNFSKLFKFEFLEIFLQQIDLDGEFRKIQRLLWPFKKICDAFFRN